MVDSKDISIVISGPVLGTAHDGQFYTREACKSARLHFWNSEVILSTWGGENISGIDYDVLVQSEDPGPNEGNINRQICSRLAGIKKASREYVLSIRSESVINSVAFLDFVDKYKLHAEDRRYIFLNNRIIIPASYPAARGELFHIGDWYFFGHKEDLIRLWNIPPMDDASYNNAPDDLLYNPHRYLITSFVKKYLPLQFEKKADINKDNREIYERVLAENFVITGFYEFGIRSLKYPLSGGFFNKLFHKEVGYTFCEWLELYNRYSNGREPIHKPFSEKFMIIICIPIKRSLPGRIFMKVRAKLFKLNYWE